MRNLPKSNSELSYLCKHIHILTYTYTYICVYIPVCAISVLLLVWAQGIAALSALSTMDLHFSAWASLNFDKVFMHPPPRGEGENFIQGYVLPTPSITMETTLHRYFTILLPNASVDPLLIGVTQCGTPIYCHCLLMCDCHVTQCRTDIHCHYFLLYDCHVIIT